MIRNWENFTHEELAGDHRADFKDWIAILPLGATEQHGQHLPIETDSLIAEGITARLAEQMSESYNIAILPVEEIGYSPEHLDHEATKSLSYHDAIELWVEIGERLNRVGIRKLLLLNAHGGNSPLMTIVATELRVRFSMLAVATSWTRFDIPEDLVPSQERAFGIHGGDIETSVLMALHPKLIVLEKLENFSSTQTELIAKNQYLHAYGKHAFGWKMQDLNSQGVVGDTTGSSAQKGEKILLIVLTGLKQLIDEIDQFDIEALDKADAAKFSRPKDEKE